MSRRQDRFRAREIIYLLDENYGIPFYEEASDI